MAKRYELSDEAWDVVSDLSIENHSRGQPRLSDRLMLDGVLWVLCQGDAWRDMPDRFGPQSTAYQRFRGWRNHGTFDQMLKRLHLRLNEPDEPPDHALGRSRGGLTTKNHMLCDANGTPLRFLLSGGQASDISYAQTCWTTSAFPQANVAARVNAVNGCLLTRATTPKRYAATAINIECSLSSRCAQ